MPARLDLSPLGNLVVTLTLLLLVAIGLPNLDFFGQTMEYLPLHSATETASVVAMFAVVAIYIRYKNHPAIGQLTVLAAGCLAVGLIDFMHTLSYETMPAFITPSSPQKAINFWLAGRLVMAVTLLAVTFTPAQRIASGRVLALFAAAIAAAYLVFWIGIFYENRLPDTFIPGQGLTIFKIGAEIVIALIFALASWRLFKLGGKSSGGQSEAASSGNIGGAEKNQSKSRIDWRMMAAAAWIFALAEAYLCMYSDVTDIFNVAGHIYKVTAAVLVFLAVKPITQTTLAVGGTSDGYSRS